MKTASSLRLGFAGSPEFAVPALQALLRSRHRVVAVFTQPDRPAGRGQRVSFGAVKLRALEHGLRILQPVSFKTAHTTPDPVQILHDLELDALVVVAYGQILTPAALAAPRLGCFNIHASLLPRWRGAAPIQRAILAGDAQTGVTIMRMAAGLDTGPMLTARAVRITDLDTGGSLHDSLAGLGGELIVSCLDAVADGHSNETPQPTAGVTYAHKISKTEAQVDWAEPAVQILRRIRAFNPWPVAETRMEGAQLRLWDAQLVPDAAPPTGAVGAAGQVRGSAAPGSVLAASDGGIDVACGAGTLRILKLQLAGRKPLSAAEFLKAQRVVGMRFSGP